MLNLLFCSSVLKDLGEYLEGEARCNFLIGKMREIKAIYMNLKAEVASIDRRRKRARRKEKECKQAFVFLYIFKKMILSSKFLV